MSNFEILALDPTTPQIRAPGAGDGYSVPRDMTFAVGTTLNAPTTVVSVNTSTDALRITQVGAGNALLVEDSANPDATPTVINASGNVGIGTASPATNLSVIGTGITDASSNGAYQVTVDNNAAYNLTPQGGIIHRFKWSSAGTLTTGAGIRFYKPNTNDSDASSQIGFLVRSGIAAQSQAMTLDSSGNLTVANGDITIATNGKKLYTNYIANNSGTNLNFDAANFLFNTGNLGLGVTPSAWTSNIKALEGASGGALSFYAAGGFPGTFITSNAYSDGTNWIAKVTDQACLYTLEGTTGKHIWSVAASNTTAGNAITFTQAMTLDASGNLKVGTTSFGTRVAISGTNAATGTTVNGSVEGMLLLRTTSSDANAGPEIAFASGYDGGGVFSITGATIKSYKVPGAGTGADQYDHGLIFKTSNSTTLSVTEKARITPGGDLCVGKTGVDPTVGLGMYTQPNGVLSLVRQGSTSGTQTLLVYSLDAAAYRFYVGMNGTISATNTTISAISDQRYKENIRDLDVGLDAILALKPRKFDWKEGKGKDIKDDRGFIAQEFEQVFPDLVDEWKDPAPEGEEPYKSVRQDLIPVLVKAMQEQQAMIEELKAKVAALEAR